MRGSALESVKQNCYRHRGWRRACVVRPPTSVMIVIIKSACGRGAGRGVGEGTHMALEKSLRAGMRRHSSRGLQQQSALKAAEVQWQPLHTAARASCDCDCGGRRQRGAWRHAERELGIRAPPLLGASHGRHCNVMGGLGFLLFASCNTHTAPLFPPSPPAACSGAAAAGRSRTIAFACMRSRRGGRPPHTPAHRRKRLLSSGRTSVLAFTVSYPSFPSSSSANFRFEKNCPPMDSGVWVRCVAPPFATAQNR